MFVCIKKTICFVSICMLACFFKPAANADMVLLTSEGEADFINTISYLVDPAGQLTVKGMIASTQFSTFETVTNLDQSFGYTNEIYWFQFDLENKSDIKTWWLQFGQAWLVEANLYLIENDKIIHQESLGKRFFFEERPVNHEKYIFPLEIPTNKKLKVLIRTQSPNMALFIRMMTPESFLKEDRQFQYFNGYFYGSIIALIFYNLIIALNLRSKSYFFYCLSLVALFFSLLSWEGLDYQYLWPHSPLWSMISNLISFGLLFFFATLFAYYFLNVEKYLPKWKKVFQFMLFLYLINTIAPFFTNLDEVASYASYTALCGALYSFPILAASWLIYRQGYSPARFFVIGYLGYVVTSALMPLRQLGVIEEPYLFNHLMKISSGFEMICLAIALAERIRYIRNERNEAQKNILETKKEFINSLEMKVQERTKKLEEANQTKDLFFTIIAHDLKGPIGNMAILLSNDMSDLLRGDSELQNELKDSANNTYKLLNNLLSWANTQKGQLQVNRQDFSVNYVIQETYDVLKSIALKKKISLKMEMAEKHFVFADPAMVTTIIRNLINNALKFTDSGGQVTIHTRKDQDQIFIMVEDDGQGMTQSKQDMLFTPGLARASRGTSGESGTGLGLLLCKEFVNLNKGTIGVESEKGKGSRFWFSIPVGQELSKDEAYQTQMANVLQRAKGISLLLVEDDPIHMKVSSSTLRQLSVEMDVAKDGEECLALSSKTEYQVILMDIDLPKRNGIEAARTILENYQNPPLLIALTANSEKELNLKYSDLPFQGYLSKPLEINRLLSILQQQWQAEGCII